MKENRGRVVACCEQKISRTPMVSSHLTALLFIGSFVNSVGAPTPVPTPITVPAAAEEEQRPTSSPVEWSNRTTYNDNGIYVINDESTSFDHESIIVTNYTTLMVKSNGYIRAPDVSDGWPAVRLSVGGIFNGTGGSVAGSKDGGQAIEMYNGQSTTDTASFGYFYDGISVNGGDAPNSVGGNALHVHGVGTEAFIYGGSFKGGKGSDGDDGLSIFALHAGKVHLHSGSFEGDMEVGDSSTIAFYGCFLKNGTTVSGIFVDETMIEINVRTRNGGRVELISTSEQECETAPSMSPTNFPTISSQPTVPLPNEGSMDGTSVRMKTAAVMFMHCIVAAVF